MSEETEANEIIEVYIFINNILNFNYNLIKLGSRIA